jgi:hypothetical protein
MDTTDRPTTDDVTALESDLLGLVEEASAREALTDDDRRRLSFRTETLCAELRACLDHDDR